MASGRSDDISISVLAIYSHWKDFDIFFCYLDSAALVMQNYYCYIHANTLILHLLPEPVLPTSTEILEFFTFHECSYSHFIEYICYCFAKSRFGSSLENEVAIKWPC